MPELPQGIGFMSVLEPVFTKPSWKIAILPHYSRIFLLFPGSGGLTSPPPGRQVDAFSIFQERRSMPLFRDSRNTALRSAANPGAMLMPCILL
jgi:hypothetical protein